MTTRFTYFLLSIFAIALQVACPTNNMPPGFRVGDPSQKDQAIASDMRKRPLNNPKSKEADAPQSDDGSSDDDDDEMDSNVFSSLKSRYSHDWEDVGSDDGRVSDYYQTHEGRPLYKQPYAQPMAQYVGFGSQVMCLGRASDYFLDDDEVNQFLVNLASPITQDMHLYRWEERRFGGLRVKGVREDGLPIFLPLGPLPPNTSSYHIASLIPGGLNNRLLPNGAGLTAYGFGLYTASTPFGSISYGDLTHSKGVGEIFLLEVTAPKGTLVLNSNSLVPNTAITVGQAMTAVGLDNTDIHNCNPPVIHDLASGWLVIKDPSRLETEEFTGKHIDQASLRQGLQSNDMPGDPARTAVLAYLRTRIKKFSPDFDG